MDREFHEHRPLGDAKHLGTDVNDAPAELKTEVERAATPYLDEHHRDRLQAALTEMEQIALAEFRDPHIGTPQLRLHDIRVKMAKADPLLPPCFHSGNFFTKHNSSHAVSPH